LSVLKFGDLGITTGLRDHESFRVLFGIGCHALVGQHKVIPRLTVVCAAESDDSSFPKRRWDDGHAGSVEEDQETGWFGVDGNDRFLVAADFGFDELNIGKFLLILRSGGWNYGAFLKVQGIGEFLSVVFDSVALDTDRLRGLASGDLSALGDNLNSVTLEENGDFLGEGVLVNVSDKDSKQIFGAVVLGQHMPA